MNNTLKCVYIHLNQKRVKTFYIYLRREYYTCTIRQPASDLTCAGLQSEMNVIVTKHHSHPVLFLVFVESFSCFGDAIFLLCTGLLADVLLAQDKTNW